MLGGNQIGPLGASAIAEALKVNEVLTSLDVSYNLLTEEVALDLVRVERQRNMLASLGLAGCKIGPIGAKEIAEWISVSGVLAEVDLSQNEIGGYWDSGQSKLAETPAGPAAIAEALKVNTVLFKLHLQYNRLNEESKQCVRNAFGSRKNFDLML